MLVALSYGVGCKFVIYLRVIYHTTIISILGFICYQMASLTLQPNQHLIFKMVTKTR